MSSLTKKSDNVLHVVNVVYLCLPGRVEESHWQDNEEAAQKRKGRHWHLASLSTFPKNDKKNIVRFYTWIERRDKL